jgi:hypothetical protein
LTNPILEIRIFIFHPIFKACNYKNETNVQNTVGSANHCLQHISVSMNWLCRAQYCGHTYMYFNIHSSTFPCGHDVLSVALYCQLSWKMESQTLILPHIWNVFFITDFRVDVYKYLYMIDWLIDWLIDWCLMSSEQFFSYIQDENI